MIIIQAKKKGASYYKSSFHLHTISGAGVSLGTIATISPALFKLTSIDICSHASAAQAGQSKQEYVGDNRHYVFSL